MRTGILDLISTDASTLQKMKKQASWGNEEVRVGGELEPHRSQRGRVIGLASPEWTMEDMSAIHVIDYSSTIIDRFCRATLQAEAYALTAGVEEAMHVRAAIADGTSETLSHQAGATWCRVSANFTVRRLRAISRSSARRHFQALFRHAVMR